MSKSTNSGERGPMSIEEACQSHVNRIFACVNACAGINPEAVPPALAACAAALLYDAEIQKCAGDPDRMSSHCSADGETLDTLYAQWLSLARGAIEMAKGESHECNA